VLHLIAALTFSAPAQTRSVMLNDSFRPAGWRLRGGDKKLIPEVAE
jgi:hypothetical protein